MTRLHISWAIFALSVFAALATFLFEVRPNQPMWDRNHPEYAERFAYAETLNTMNPGLSEQRRAKVRATIPPIIKNIRKKFPDAPEDRYANAEATLEKTIDAFFSDNATAVRHFWATHYSVDDMKLIVHNDRLAYWPYFLHRLRLWWTHRKSMPVLHRMMSGLKKNQEELMMSTARELYHSFQN